MNMVTTTFFTPESRFCREHAPHEGMGCFRVIVQLPNEQSTFEDVWLHLNELHCPFDPEWRRERFEVVWKNLGRALFTDELVVIDRATKQRTEQEKVRRGYEDWEDGQAV